MFTYPAHALADVSQMYVSLYEMETPGRLVICFVVTPSGFGGNCPATNELARTMLLANSHCRTMLRLEMEADSLRTLFVMKAEAVGDAQDYFHSGGKHILKLYNKFGACRLQLAIWGSGLSGDTN